VAIIYFGPMLTNIRFTTMGTKRGLELVILYTTEFCFLASYIPQNFRSLFAAFMVALSNVLSRGDVKIFLLGTVRQPSSESIGTAGQLPQRSIRYSEGLPNILSPMTGLCERDGILPAVPLRQIDSRGSFFPGRSLRYPDCQSIGQSTSEAINESINALITSYHIIFGQSFDHRTSNLCQWQLVTTMGACPLIQ
jgi:hypothetical protein